MNKQREEFICLFLGMLFMFQCSVWAQDKEWDDKVIYSEARVPFYELPDPLVTVSGNRVTTMKEWESKGFELDLCTVGTKASAFFKRFGGNIVAQPTHLGDDKRQQQLAATCGRYPLDWGNDVCL